jgi:monomeric sarcosine oxidase
VTAYDVVVAGLGGFGSATAAHLGARGQRVLGLDRHQRGHTLGASHGETRIVRQAYFEGAGYVPLLQRAYELWDRLEADSGTPMLRRTGGVFLGRPGSRVFQGSLATASQWGLEHEVLDPAEVRARFPAISPPHGTSALFEPQAGVVSPEAAVEGHLEQAAAAGAELRHDEPVLEWSATPDGVRVRTSAATYDAGALVLAPGRWAGTLLADLGLPLLVERRVMHWFDPPAGIESFAPDRFPIWIWERDDGTAPYGAPAVGAAGDGVKVAVHYSATRPADAWEPRELAAILAPLLPGLGDRHVRAVGCTYTLTPDEHFVVGRHPAHDRVLLACGFSGHGFKFTPVIGEALADLVVDGRTDAPLDLFDPTRFAG